MNITTLTNLGVLLSKTNDNPFAEAAKPIVNLINMAVGPLIAIVVALGAIYGVFLGIKLAKAEEPQDKQKAKGQLKNAIIGFLLIFVILVVLKVASKPMLDWVNSVGGQQISMDLPSGQ
ncbi:MAG: pilin [Lachnospiraceae bacterium]|jgi:Na+-driven multidrug efflux pump|nr:pilin [Lachnospiraceae bacterium]